MSAGQTRITLAGEGLGRCAVDSRPCSPRFARDFVLGSQGDLQQIYLRQLAPTPVLQVLDLSQTVNDTPWVSDPGGTLYVSDKSADAVVALRGAFAAGRRSSR